MDTGRSRSKTTIISILLISIFFACSNEELVDINPDVVLTNWVKTTGIEEGIFNSAFINNRLYLMGANSFYADAKINLQNSPFEFGSYISRPGWHKLPISDKVLASRTETSIFIFPVSNLKAESYLEINPKDLDPTFLRFEDIPRWQSEGMGISEKGSLLVPYRAAVGGIAENNPRFFLINTNQNQQEILITKISTIKPNLIDYFDQVYQIASFNDFFIANIGGEIIQINADGDYSKIGSYNSFISAEIESEIYSFGIHSTNQEVTIYKSQKDGSKRQILNKVVLDPLFNGLELTTINNKIVGFRNDKIYLIEIEPNRLKLSEINNSQLVGGIITSIIQINKTVLVTASCNVNLCGTYTKSLEDFFEFKKN